MIPTAQCTVCAVYSIHAALAIVAIEDSLYEIHTVPFKLISMDCYVHIDYSV